MTGAEKEVQGAFPPRGSCNSGGSVVRGPGTQSFQSSTRAILGGGGAKPWPLHRNEWAGWGSCHSNRTRPGAERRDRSGLEGNRGAASVLCSSENTLTFGMLSGQAAPESLLSGQETNWNRGAHSSRPTPRSSCALRCLWCRTYKRAAGESAWATTVACAIHVGKVQSRKNKSPHPQVAGLAPPEPKCSC